MGATALFDRTEHLQRGGHPLLQGRQLLDPRFVFPPLKIPNVSQTRRVSVHCQQNDASAINTT